MGNIEAFAVSIDGAVLDDLRERLRRTRLPRDFGNEDWSYGTNGTYLRSLLDYWLEVYDWRARERAMNELAHFRTTIDGLPIHFVHARGRGPAPVPLVLSHGWPWTFWDFREVIGPLSDPAAYGGDPADAFDVVVPSLPGFGFSTPLTRTGVNAWTTADLWHELMTGVLGYGRFAAAGGDWGAIVTAQLGHKYAEQLIGIHVVGTAGALAFFSGERPWDPFMEYIASLTGEDRARFVEWSRRFASHVAVQVLDPQTLACALHDSPAGLCAWLLERRRAWSDCGGDVERRFSKDTLLDHTMLYWATEAFSSSVRYYAEAARYRWTPSHDRTPLIEVPTGVTVYRPDAPPLPLRSADPRLFPLCFERVRESGGHFAPAEDPAGYVEDLRETFRSLRTRVTVARK